MNKFIADDGYYFAKADLSAVYENILILGVNDKIENYVQITIEEAKELKNKIREEHDKLRKEHSKEVNKTSKNKE